MKKKLLSIMLAAAMLAASVPCVSAQNDTVEAEPAVAAEPVRTFVDRRAAADADMAEVAEDEEIKADLFASVTVEVDGFTVTYDSTAGTAGVTKYSGSQTEVEIPETFVIDGTAYTVTSVKGFSSNTTVTSVTLPATVTTIADNAFYGCTALEKVNIPDGVTAINKYAFRNCKSLKKLVIPAGVTSIGTYAFNTCSALEYMYFKGDVPASIGSNAFGSINSEAVFYCNLSKESEFEACDTFKSLKIDFETVDDYYVIENGVLTGFNPSVDGNAPRSIVSIPGYIIDEDMPVTSIAEDAFDGVSGIKTVVIPKNVTLNFTAFPDSVKTVYFRGEAPSAEIALSSDAEICTTPDNEKTFVQSAYWNRFARRTYDDSFEFDTRVGEITGYLKESTKDNLSVEIPADIYGVPVEIIGGKAFEGYQYIESVKIPSSVSLIDSAAFRNCKNLYAINANENDENVLNVQFIGPAAFYGCESLSQLIFNDVCMIGEGAFFNCRNLSKVEINGDKDFVFGETFENPILTYLAVYLAYPVEGYPDFYGTKGAIIGADAFCGNYVAGSNATATSGVAPSLREGVKLSNIGFIDEFAFNGTDIRSIVIPEGVKKIGRAAFGFCEELESVTLPSTLEVIEGGSNYKPGDDDREKACDGAFAFCISLIDITVPDSVTDVGSMTFAGSAVAEVTLSENLTKIPFGLFKACENLETIVIPDKVTLIETASNVKFGAFADCTALKKVTTPSGLESIGDFAFANCAQLKTVASDNGKVSDVLKTVGKQAFDGCSKLASETDNVQPLWMPDTVETIGEKAFQKCTSLCLKNGALPASLTTLGGSAFINCSALTEAKIPSGLTTIPASAFKSSGLVNLEIPATVTSVGKNAYESCGALVELKATAATAGVEDTELSILDAAFKTCKALENITFERQNVSLGKTAFSTCSALKNVNTEKVDEITIGQEAFASCTALTNTGLRKDIKVSFDVKAYTNSGLTEFVAPDNVMNIPAGIFYDCTSLSNVVLHDNVLTIEGSEKNKGAFANCTALKTIELPANLADIQGYAFNASGIETITLPDSITTVNADVFLDCTSLTKVNLGKKTEVIGGSYEYKDSELSSATSLSDSKLHGAFKGCTALKSIELPETLEEIRTFAFAGSGLTEFTYPEGFDAVSDGVFYKCADLTSVSLNDDLTKIGRFAFANCSSLTEIEIPRAVTLVSTRAFMNDTALEMVRIGDVEGKAVVTLETAVFYNCESLNYIIFSGILPEYNATLFGSADIKPVILYFTRFFDESREDDAAWAENFTMVAIDKQFTYEETEDGECSIEKYTGNLPIAIIPGVVLDTEGNSMKVTGIVEGAFDGSKVTAISLPSDVEGLSNNVFFGAEKLEKINISALNENYKTSDGILYNENGNTLIYCPAAKKGVVNIDDTVTTVETGAFYGNSLSAITVSDTHKYYSSADGVFMSKAGDVIIAYPNAKGAAYKVAENVTSIEDYAFTNAAMVITFEGLTAPTVAENAIADGATIKIYPDATGFDADAFADLKILFIGKAIINKVEKLEDGTINVTYHNYNENSVSAKTFAALYDNGVMVQVTEEEDVALASGEELVKNFSFDKTGDTVKVFIWDSWEGMAPVEEAAVQNIG